MFGRKNVVTAASDALDGVSPYVDQLAHDEKLRRRLAAAIAAGAAARKRARRQTGLRGLATRLATDPVLRAQVAEATVQLQKANSRLKRHRSHKLRNTALFLAGVGAVVAAVPSARETVLSKLGLDSDDDYGPMETPPAAESPGYGVPGA